MEPKENNIKVYICCDLDYVSGYLRHGYKEGVINISKEEIKEFEENPIKYIKENYLLTRLETIPTDWRVEDYGEPTEIEYKIFGENN